MNNRIEEVDLNRFFANLEPRVVAAALRLVEGDQVTEIKVDASGASALVFERNQTYRVRVVIADNMANMQCTCGRMRGSPCEHALALLASVSANPVDEDLFSPVETGASPARGIFQQLSTQQFEADWQELLDHVTIKTMREVAAARGVKLKGLQRVEACAGLMKILTDPAGLKTAIEKLKPDARRLLYLLSLLLSEERNQYLFYVKPYLESAQENWTKIRPVEQCLDDLVQQGLVWWVGESQTFRLPLQVSSQLPPDPELFKTRNTVPARISKAVPFGFLRLALRLLLLANSGWLKCAPAPAGSKRIGYTREAGRPESKEMNLGPEWPYLEEKLRGQLAAGLKQPPELVDLAARLLGAAEVWRRRSPEKITDRLPAWLERSPQRQAREIFESAAGFGTQLELDLACAGSALRFGAKVDSLPEFRSFQTALGRCRLRLVQLLAMAPAGQWLEVEAILRIIHGLQPGFFQEFSSRQDQPEFKTQWKAYPFWVSDASGRLDALRYPDWRKSYGRLYEMALTTTLRELGLVDVGWAADQSAVVRISEFGEFLLGRRDDFPLPPSQGQALSISQNWDLHLDLDHAGFDLVNFLGIIAVPLHPEQAGKDLVPRKLAYRLADTGLCRAFETGLTLDELTGRLAQALGAALPEKLHAQMSRLWERFGRLNIYEDLALIEFTDDFCLPELLAGTSLSQILVYTFSPRLVAVRSEMASAYMSELQTRGYTPRLEERIRER